MAKDEDKKTAPEDEAKDKEGEGEGGGEGEEGLHPPKKKLSTTVLILIIVAVVVLLGGGGAGLYFSGILGGTEEAAAPGDKKEGDHAGKSSEEEEHDPNIAPVFFPLGDILVNLSGDGKRPSFLKIRVSLELADEKDVAALETLKPRIIDHFQVYLRELRVEDLRGSAGLYRLREELLLRVSEAVQPIRVRDVLFQEMLVQ